MIGLSPRGRGNRRGSRRWQRSCRSIPAWAGEPNHGTLTGSLRWVYPRVGGGTCGTWKRSTSMSGLSPRGRGNRWSGRTFMRLRRSIPAWAGEPGGCFSCGPFRAVYPRVGGGTFDSVAMRYPLSGLSPRGRGEPSKGPGRIREGTVYPRVGGGTSITTPAGWGRSGLSPRGRGNQPGARTPALWSGSIPAWAGEPNRYRIFPFTCKVYPRVGGGTLIDVRFETGYQGLVGGGTNMAVGYPVYPRVGGGTVSWTTGKYTLSGLSPRGRGNLRILPESPGVQRSIPAWAGEPSWRRPRYPGSPRGRGTRGT